MPTTGFNPRLRLILHAALFWMASLVLGGMVLDGGVLLMYYSIGSFLLWPALLIISHRHLQWSVTASAVFRVSPLLLFILCFVITSVVTGIGGR